MSRHRTLGSELGVLSHLILRVTRSDNTAIPLTNAETEAQKESMFAMIELVR